MAAAHIKKFSIETTDFNYDGVEISILLITVSYMNDDINYSVLYNNPNFDLTNYTFKPDEWKLGLDGFDFNMSEIYTEPNIMLSINVWSQKCIEDESIKVNCEDFNFVDSNNCTLDNEPLTFKCYYKLISKINQ